MRKAAAVSLLVLALLPLRGVLPFAATLPAGLPRMQGCEVPVILWLYGVHRRLLLER